MPYINYGALSVPGLLHRTTVGVPFLGLGSLSNAIRGPVTPWGQANYNPLISALPTPQTPNQGGFLSVQGAPNIGAAIAGVDPGTAMALGIPAGSFNLGNALTAGLMGGAKGAVGSLAHGNFSPAAMGMGFLSGLTGNLGAQLGNIAGQGLLGLTGMNPATSMQGGLSAAIQGALGVPTGLTNTITGLAPSVAGIFGGPAAGIGTSLGLGALNAAISALQGNNISSNIAGMITNAALFGLGPVIGHTPVVGPALSAFIGNTVNPTLAAAINALGQAIGIAAPSPAAMNSLAQSLGLASTISGVPADVATGLLGGQQIDIGNLPGATVTGPAAANTMDTTEFSGLIGPTPAQMAAQMATTMDISPLSDATISSIVNNPASYPAGSTASMMSPAQIATANAYGALSTTGNVTMGTAFNPMTGVPTVAEQGTLMGIMGDPNMSPAFGMEDSTTSPAPSVTAPDTSTATSTSPGAGGGDGGKVICTWYYKHGLIDPEMWGADEAYAKTQPWYIVKGYQRWAIPVRDFMEKHPWSQKYIIKFAKPWAEEMAHRAGKRETGNWFGKVLIALGTPFSALMGRRFKRIDSQSKWHEKGATNGE